MTRPRRERRGPLPALDVATLVAMREAGFPNKAIWTVADVSEWAVKHHLGNSGMKPRADLQSPYWRHVPGAKVRIVPAMIDGELEAMTVGPDDHMLAVVSTAKGRLVDYACNVRLG